MSRSFVFVTGNANKLKEVQAILSVDANGIQVSSEALDDLPEIQGTTVQVATAKCTAAALQIEKACVTEDTALAFTALNGLPGPYIKDFMEAVGHEGLNAILAGFEDKSATAICTFAYCPGPGQAPLIFEGRTEGKIVPARGAKVFGWDAVFQPDGFFETYAEMDPKTKNTISHRYRALAKLKDHLNSLPESS
ncbi:inosine triphosphate pyrophosphatase [Phaffia rhodozyma]|uniref:Inosine triphosphate pyrophosphatase n=1 Tax=Phaffia rhodozyma TaxID=264483 RepID=A0A0F7SQZ7_PHARH|nr:inosine triphosphate pyrophosphatase [Phaffia rhodozyma]